jgi:hypothetical protein
MSDNFSDEVFLTQDSKDKPRVRCRTERFKQAGLRAWVGEWNIK